MPAGIEQRSAAEVLDEDGLPAGVRVEALPVLAEPGNPTVAPRRYGADRLAADVRERTGAYAGLDALRDAVAGSDAACRNDAAAAARHAEPIVRFLCSAFGDGLAGVRVSDDHQIVITATLPDDRPGEVSISVGPEGNCACRISSGDTHLASTAPDTRSFERVLKSRLAGIGVVGQDDAARD